MEAEPTDGQSQHPPGGAKIEVGAFSATDSPYTDTNSSENEILETYGARNLVLPTDELGSADDTKLDDTRKILTDNVVGK